MSAGFDKSRRILRRDEFLATQKGGRRLHAPHLVVIVRCPTDAKSSAALEVTFHRDGEQIARNVQPLAIEPGKFNYRLVRAELGFDEPGTVEAHCRIDLGPATKVPYTLMAPLS